ncbi:MAG: DUF5985 family protein [Pirellulaceae bacterium]
MAALVYLLCAGTALMCCVLLLRGHRRSQAPLLFWSGLCFAALTIDNLLLYADRLLFPHVDLWLYRVPAALIAVGLLLYGLVWKTNRN